jgi:hypothetical protein
MVLFIQFFDIGIEEERGGGFEINCLTEKKKKKEKIKEGPD